MRKIRVIHIADKFGVKGSSVHGVSRLFTWWLPRFNSDRFDVKLVGLRPPSKASKNLSRQGIKVLNLNKGKFDPSTLTSIIDLIREDKADILHLHGYGASNFGRLAARVTKVKSIVHEHFVDPNMPAYQAVADYALCSLTDYGIAVSESVKRFMKTKRRIPGDRLEVIFNGAPLSTFEPLGESEIMEEKNRWGINNKNKIVGTIGRLDEQKGIDYLIEASKRVLRKIKNVTFVVVGDGPMVDDLKNKCVKKGVDSNFVFTGYQSDIPRIQSMFDIQVFPSLWEGTPLTLFEAMSMEKPIVSTNVDGLGEVLRHGETALLVPPRDDKTLADFIIELLSDCETAKVLGTRAKKDSRNYDIQKTVDCIEMIYDKVMYDEG